MYFVLEVDFPVSRIVLMQQYKDSRNTLKRRKKDKLQQPLTTVVIEEQTVK